MRPIEQKREAIKRKAQLEIEALSYKDTEFEDENRPQLLDRATSPRKAELASLELAALSHTDKLSTVSHTYDVTNTSDITVSVAEAVT